MLSEATFKELGAFLRLCKATKGLPFTYDAETHRLNETTRKHRAWYLFMVCWMILRGLYTFTLVLLSWFQKRSPSTTDMVMEICYAGSFAVVSVLNLGYYIQRDSLINLVNDLFRFDATATVKSVRKGAARRSTDGVTLYIKLLRMSPVTTAVSFGGLLYFLQRKKDMYRCYPVPEEYGNVVVGVYVVLESYTLLWMWCMTFFLWFFVLIYGNVCTFWLEKIKKQANTTSTEHAKSIRTYRAIQILTTEFNNTFQDIYWPAFKEHVVLMQTISIYTCVKFHDTVNVSILLSYVFCIFLCTLYQYVTLRLMGDIRILSAGYKNAHCHAGLRKQIRSLPILGVTVRGWYAMGRQTVLTFMSLVINVTVHFLVST